MAQMVKRAYKYRCHPTPEQAEEFARTFGCVRLVYNKALEERTRAYTLEGRRRVQRFLRQAGEVSHVQIAEEVAIVG
jgi:transposase